MWPNRLIFFLRVSKPLLIQSSAIYMSYATFFFIIIRSTWLFLLCILFYSSLSFCFPVNTWAYWVHLQWHILKISSANSRTSVISGYVFTKISPAYESHITFFFSYLFIIYWITDIFTLTFVSQNLLYSFEGCWSLFW